jgi:peptide-methionine (S)-S-oxide reductase
VTAELCISISFDMADQKTDDTTGAEGDQTETAVFGTGCFWCSEAVFKELRGVLSVMPGYTGGTVPHPTYQQVCTGTTGHVEVSQVVFDPRRIDFDGLLKVFWQVHDPTSLDRQGADVGTQYRSAIFHTSDEQRQKAEKQKAALERSGAWDRPIVTQIVPLSVFYSAENYHHDYFANNPDQGYCRMVVRPKVEKFRKAFHDKLK